MGPELTIAHDAYMGVLYTLFGSLHCALEILCYKQFLKQKMQFVFAFTIPSLFLIVGCVCVFGGRRAQSLAPE